jgi:hypothetical protein
VRPHSIEFAATVTQSHRRASRVSLLNSDLSTDQEISGESGIVIEGTVGIDPQRRRSLSLRLVNEDGAWTPTGAADPLYLNRLLKVERGVYVGEGPEYVTLGVFLIDSPSVTVGASGATIDLQGQDRLKLALRSAFTKPTRYDEGMALGTVIRSIAQDAGMGATLYRLNDGGRSLKADRSFESGDNRVDAMRLLADAYGLILYVDAEGYFVVEPALTSLTIPEIAYTFERGTDAIMLGIRKGWNDDRLYNHVLVSGEASDLAPVSAEARDLNPLSPAYNPLDGTGPIGDRLFTYTSAMIRTEEQAQEVANALLLEVALIEETIDLPSIVHPAIEAGDVIGVIEPISKTNDAYIVDGMSIPIGAGSMTISSKKVRELTETQPPVIVVAPVVIPPTVIIQASASVTGRATISAAATVIPAGGGGGTPTSNASTLPFTLPKLLE